MKEVLSGGMKAMACAVALVVVACGDGGAPSRQPDPSWIADVKARAHALATIDVKAGDDSDLLFLNNVLAGRRIVELGENTHGAA